MGEETDNLTLKACTVSGRKRSFRQELTIEPAGTDAAVVSGKMFDAGTGELDGVIDTVLMKAPVAKVTAKTVKDYQEQGFRDIQMTCDF